MKHLGDITLIDGAVIPPVDIITGGSPCQDLSVAGKRAGLTGERSGLFMEQIRVVREMREATHGKKPRYMLWENVPGALTSKKGEDFRAILEETVRIADPEANIPRPPAGRWPHAGYIVGDGCSLAYRVHDAQFWGSPAKTQEVVFGCRFWRQYRRTLTV
jgi:DNA (cytosine-5)-methyltransferase 1